MEKNSYERGVYESVDDKKPVLGYKNGRKTEFMQQGAKMKCIQDHRKN